METPTDCEDLTTPPDSQPRPLTTTFSPALTFNPNDDIEFLPGSSFFQSLSIPPSHTDNPSTNDAPRDTWDTALHDTFYIYRAEVARPIFREIHHAEGELFGVGPEKSVYSGPGADQQWSLHSNPSVFAQFGVQKDTTDKKSSCADEIPTNQKQCETQTTTEEQFSVVIALESDGVTQLPIAKYLGSDGIYKDKILREYEAELLREYEDQLLRACIASLGTSDPCLSAAAVR